MNGLVHDQALIDSVFEGIDSFAHGHAAAAGVESRLPVPAPRAALLRGTSPQRHADAVRRPSRSSADAHRRRRRPRRSRRASGWWRPGSRCVRRSAGRRAGATSRASPTSGAPSRPSIASGWRSRHPFDRSLASGARSRCAFMPAASVRPGMVMFTRGRRVRPRRDRRARPARRGRSTTSTSRTRTTSSPAGSSPTTRSTASAEPTSRTSSNFQDDYPDAHVVKLEQNYRSTQTILDAANAVISNNRGQMAKHLWTDVGEGDPVRVREMADEHAEARCVTAEIERLVDEGVSRAEIAVFYRTNAQSRVIEDMLVRKQIAYQVIGGTKFYERAEIKDAVNYLTFLVNPQDATAFTRIANSPRRGLGQTSMSRVLVVRRDAGDHGLGGRDLRHPRPGDRGAQVARALHVDDAAPARAGRERRARGAGARGAAGGDRLQGGARVRADDRGPGPAREPRGARARARRSTTRRRPRAARSASSCSRSRCSPTRTRSATTRAS